MRESGVEWGIGVCVGGGGVNILQLCICTSVLEM